MAYAVLADTRDPEWQFYFLVCLYAYLELHGAFRLAALCFRGLLTVALESGKLPATSARRLLLQLAQKGKHHQALNFSDSAIRVDAPEGAHGSKVRATKVDELALKLEETARLTELTEDNETNGNLGIEELGPADPLAVVNGTEQDSE